MDCKIISQINEHDSLKGHKSNSTKQMSVCWCFFCFVELLLWPFKESCSFVSEIILQSMCLA